MRSIEDLLGKVNTLLVRTAQAKAGSHGAHHTTARHSRDAGLSANGSSSDGGVRGCPVISTVPLQPRRDGSVDFSSAPTEAIAADSERYIALQLGRAKMMGFTEVILAVNSRKGDADVLVQSHNGTVYGRSNAKSDGDDSVYEDYVVVPAAHGVTAHAFIVPVNNTDAQVTVLMSFRKDGACVVPFKIAGLDKSVTDPSVIDLKENAAPRPVADKRLHAGAAPPHSESPRHPPGAMPTFAAYKQLPGLPEGQADMAKRLIDGIRQGNDTAGAFESSGLDPWEYRLAKNVSVGNLWKAKDVSDFEQYYYYYYYYYPPYYYPPYYPPYYPYYPDYTYVQYGNNIYKCYYYSNTCVLVNYIYNPILPTPEPIYDPIVYPPYPTPYPP
ncbi:unnamed protein product [Vitrella brassicaformis CCMP3155]|uniref:Uncharacterized protein n=1 Tax=Vitrella brassicaformis (strain CCMP3155) TaxID=1169540 RepID=A0A0G4G494_VITBC|nr:unnamed protein product [Vitrella brassicaformis CCMP3155]|eukprot:CEM23140.1 unnamed protein product [Vitrella brassicaformis CCMP3155]